MHVLFVHKNFPAQFGHIAGYLVEHEGFQCTFVSEREPGVSRGVRRIQYAIRGGATKQTHYCSRSFENFTWHSHAVYPQKTTYLYESQFDGSLQTNAVYPDSSDTAMVWKDVSSLTRSDTTATVTVTAHGYSTDDWVSVAGADQAEYNGQFQITGVTTNTFTYTVAGSPITPATGDNIRVRLLGKDVTSLTRSGTTATATVTAHGYVTGNWVSIAGADQPEYNGWVQITYDTDDTFTYTVSDSAAATATGDDIRVHLLGDDQVKTTYDRRGRTVTATDQRGVEHTFTFDSAGRLSDDTVTDLGSSGIVDDAVRAIVTTYDDIGRLETVTSYDHPTTRENGNIVNQVQYTYGGWGNLIQEHQEHDGVVDNDTLHVDYTYADGASGGVAKYVRLDKLIYPNAGDPPNGREVNYDYGTTGGTNDVLSRLAAIKDDGGTPVLASYEYLGAGTVVEENYEQPDVKLDYTGTSHSYSGFDRFGRVVDHLWRDYGASADADRFLYGYDRASNRTWKENDVAANLGTPIHLDELYGYDDVYQLIAISRGNLADAQGGGKEILGEVFAQDWTLEATGNWSEFDDDGDSQTRDHNEANEIEKIDNSTDDIAHDAAGNMIRLPKLDGSGEHFHVKYDAWNRVVEIYNDNGETLIAEYRYDGTGRRIIKGVDDGTDGSLDTFTHFLHDGQQVIETRKGDDVSGEPPAAEGTDVKHQNIWSPRYIDSLILRDADEQRVFYLADANYNVTALVATNGDVLERYVYTPYGVLTIYDDDWSDTRSNSSYDNTTLYTGRELDSETGIYYYRARYYHAELGRLVGRDPIGYLATDVNLYRYVGNSPLSRTDPTGEAWWNLWLCDLGYAAGDAAGTAWMNWNLIDADFERCGRRREIAINNIVNDRTTSRENVIHTGVRDADFAIGSAKNIAEIGVNLEATAAMMACPASQATGAIVHASKAKISHMPTSGAKLVTNPCKTTTVLGSYSHDMKAILKELNVPAKTGHVDHIIHGFKQGNKGGFNFLHVSEDVYMAGKHRGGFFDKVNTAWVDDAVARGDDIVVASQRSYMYDDYGELTGFGKEVDRFINVHGYQWNEDYTRLLQPCK